MAINTAFNTRNNLNNLRSAKVQGNAAMELILEMERIKSNYEAIEMINRNCNGCPPTSLFREIPTQELKDLISPTKVPENIPNPTGTLTDPVGGGETVTDIDGNVYRTVKIGSQTWMVENLKVSRFNNGASIPNINDLVSWQNFTGPASCYSQFNSSASNGLIYNLMAGKSSNIAPVGWHVPTASDWFSLCEYLGGTYRSYLDYSYYNGIANKLGALSAAPPYTTNSSGFGAKKEFILYYSSWGDGYFGVYWTSTIQNGRLRNVEMTSSGVDYNSVFIRGGYSANGFGLPIRCIKN